MCEMDQLQADIQSVTVAWKKAATETLLNGMMASYSLLVPLSLDYYFVSSFYITNIGSPFETNVCHTSKRSRFNFCTY